MKMRKILLFALFSVLIITPFRLHAQRNKGRGSDTYTMQNASIGKMAIDEDSKTIAIAEKNVVHIISCNADTLTGTMNFDEITSINIPLGITCIAISHDAEYVAVGCSDRAVHVWDIAEKKETNIFKVKYLDKEMIAEPQKAADYERFNKEYKQYPSEVTSIAFSLVGNYILAGYADNTVKKWSIDENKKVSDFPGNVHKWLVSEVVATSDYVYTAGKDNSIVRWSSNGTKLMSYDKHCDEITGISVNTKKNWLASSSSDNTFKLWDIPSGKMLASIQGKKDAINSIAIEPIKNYIATADNQALCIWSVKENNDKTVCIKNIRKEEKSSTSEITDVKFNKTGSFLFILTRNTLSAIDIKDIMIMDFFSKQIDAELEKMGANKGKGEFETAAQYTLRLSQIAQKKQELMEKYRKNYEEEMKKIQDEERRNELKKYKQVPLTIDELSIYDADNEVFNIVILEENISLNVPLAKDEAKKFKDNYYKNAIKVTALAKQEGSKTLYKSIEITQPGFPPYKLQKEILK